MLTRFVIEPRAIAKERFGDDVAMLQRQLDHLTAFWTSHGVLVRPKSSRSMLEWQSTIKQLPVKLRERFRSLFLDDTPLPAYRTMDVEADIDFDLANSYSELTHMTGAWKIDIALLEHERAVRLGLHEDDTCACNRFPDLAQWTEITRWHLVGGTCKTKELSDLSGRDIKHDDDPQDIWSQRLKSYAEHSNDIVIADPYATYDLPKGKHDDISANGGLVNLLQYIIDTERRTDEKKAPNANITVYSTYDDRHGANPGQ